ncbi:MAG: hypothetical protein AAGG75_18605 [Bacteroidota bacterium]
MKYRLSLLLLLFTTALYTQTPVSGDLFAHIQSTIQQLPGSGESGYGDVDAANEEPWRELLRQLIAADYASAAAAAAPLGYQLLRFTDTADPDSKVYYLLEKTEEGTNYWGTYLFRPNACRALVIQCPHPRADLNTGLEGIFAYRQLDAFGYFLSGTHRCNSTVAVSCSGSTSVCSAGSQAYRESDVAHNTRSAFQMATEEVREEMPEQVFVQLHGFSKRDTDPFVIMSNGSRDAPAVDYAALLAAGLEAEDAVLDFKIGHLDTEWSRLLGFTNTQGRYINQSLDPCTENAAMGNGHFIHVEQERTRLRADETGWQKMANALGGAFSCVVSGVEEVERGEAWYALSVEGRLRLQLPSGRYELRIYNALGQLLAARTVGEQEEIWLPEVGGIGFFSLWKEGTWLGSGRFVR